MINIWYKPEGGQIEKIDEATGKKDAAYLVREYRIAYGGHKCKIWAGRKKNEPGKD